MKTRPEEIGAELADLVSGIVDVDIFNRVAFSTDASIYQIFPQCVVAARNEEDIAAVVRYARANGLSVAPRGAGSGVAGESLTSGIVIDVRRFMDRILHTAEDGSVVTVQPGVVLDDLNVHLAQYGRMIGPDPSSGNRAVVGGCVANNATGAHSLKYGHMDRYVERVRAVLADGNIAELVNSVEPMEAGGRPEAQLARQCADLLAGKEAIIKAARPGTKRNRSGYTIDGVVHDGRADLARLMAGSEGTLAVFTEITLRTVEIPTFKALIQLEFDCLETMARAVPLIADCGPAACELMDQRLMSMARRAYPKYRDVLPEECAATLLVEMIADSETSLREEIGRVRLAVADMAVGAVDVYEPRMQQRLWKARKDAVPLLNSEKGAAHPIPFMEDVSVAPARLAEYIAGLENIGKKHHFQMAFYGHAGDGELHIRPYIDLSNAEGVAKMKTVAEEVFTLAWSLGGSISGEHADGLVRAAFLRRQYGDEYYELLKGIKRIFDPEGILNPGKILNDDPEVMTAHLRLPGGSLSQRSALLLGPEEFRFEAEQCSGCGVCLVRAAGSRMCPVFRAMNEELASSRAKANLLRTLSHPSHPAGEYDRGRLREILSLCVNCKMCSVQCPAGVDVSKLIIEARAQLARQTGFSAAEFALAHNRRLSALGSAFAPLSNWILVLPPVRWLMEKTIGLDRTRRFPTFQRGSFVRKARRDLAGRPEISPPADRAAYFVDSFVNWNDHELGFAVINLLRKLNVKVMVPQQRPAPLPAYVYGNLDTARRDLEYNLGQFAPLAEKGCKIVCSEPSAALCLKDEMKYLIDSESARLVSDRTYELMDYLNDLLCRTGINQTEKITSQSNCRYAYHAPCHLQALRTETTTIELLGRLGVEVTDLNGGCCGLAGTAGMQKKHHNLSEAISGMLRQRIEAVNPDVVLTECAACAMQIEHLTGRKTLHPVKLVAALLDG